MTYILLLSLYRCLIDFGTFSNHNFIKSMSGTTEVETYFLTKGILHAASFSYFFLMGFMPTLIWASRVMGLFCGFVPRETNQAGVASIRQVAESSVDMGMSTAPYCRLQVLMKYDKGCSVLYLSLLSFNWLLCTTKILLTVFLLLIIFFSFSFF